MRMNIITKLRKLNIELTLVEGKLRVNAPEGVVNQDILAEIKTHKEELMAFISRVAEKDAYNSIPKAEEREYYHLSAPQKQIYFLYNLDRTSLAYNMPQALELNGTVEEWKIAKAFNQLMARHEGLRTCFTVIDDEPVQRLLDVDEIKIEHYTSSEDKTEEVIRSFVRPFDLDHAPLFRVGLLTNTEDSHLLMIDMHHIIADGMSQAILIRDFMALYKGEGLPDVPVQPKDYAMWQISKPDERAYNDNRTYWLDEYASEPAGLNLPTDFNRPAVKSYSGSKYECSLDSKYSQKIRSIAEEEGTTVFVVMLSVYYVLLSRLSNQQDIVIGVPVAGREHVDLENTMGMFVRTLPLRNQVGGELTFAQFLKQTSGKTLSAMDHQRYAYETLIDELRLTRDASRNPLFDVLFVFENYLNESFDVPGLSIKPHAMSHEVSKFDLTLEVKETGGQLKLTLEYCTDLFRQDTIERIVTYLQRIVAAICADRNVAISEIDIMPEQERHLILKTFNNTGIAYPERETVISLFEKQAGLTPENIAVKLPHISFTYGEINQKSNQVAAFLTYTEAVKKGDLIGLLMEREEDLIPVVFGIMKAGAAYIPIDPKFPSDRICAIAEDSGLKFIVSKSGYHKSGSELGARVIDLDRVEATISGQPATGIDVKPEPGDLAYIIYTSGSTGRPKGVMIEHRSVYNIIQCLQDMYPLNEKDCYLLKTTYSFDVSVTELFGWFHAGGSIYMLPAGAEGDSDAIIAAIADGNVTHMNFVPSMFAVFVDVLGLRGIKDLASLRYIFLAGEALPMGVIKRFNALQTNVRLENIYGPTEGTIYSCGFSTAQLEDRTIVPIGKPLHNISLYILDQENRLQPVGVAGELCIGGRAVARGYLHNEQLTVEKFIANPFKAGERIYKTGDLARWLPDGNIEYLGRLDNQVKIRGFRIELGEIENILTSHATVRESMVMAKGDEGDRYLVAYYVSGSVIHVDELKSYLAAQLPDYMVPAYFIHLDQFPLTPNGKIDRKALPDPEVTGEQKYVPPANQTEEKLVSIWSSILKMNADMIGVTSSFFELGGNSLRATVLTNRIFKEFAVEVPLKEIFNRQDIYQLALYIDEAAKSAFETIPQAPESTYYPVSSSQKRLYFLYEFDKSSVAYNLPQALYIEGIIDIDRLKKTFIKLISRHESLRTSFEVVKGMPVQQISDISETIFEMPVFKATESEIDTVVRDFIRPFVLNQAPLVRAGVVDAPTEHILLVDIHHIVTDGISQGVLVEDFTALYEGTEPSALRLQYKDYAVWQQSSEQQAKLEDHKAFWVQEFEEVPEALELPVDFARPLSRKYTGDTLKVNLSREDTSKLKAIADREGVTMFMLVLSLYNILLSKLSNQDDIVVGVPVSGRQHADLDAVIGMFVNTLPLRNQIRSHQTFKSSLSALKEKVLASFEHQTYPYELLIDDLSLERGTTHNPLFDVMFVFENFEQEQLTIEGLSLKSYQLQRHISKFDLSLEAGEVDGELFFNFEYSTELFRRETIQRFVSYLKSIVSAVTVNPDIKLSEIELLSEEERTLLLDHFNDTAFAYSKKETVISLFESSARNNPKVTALVDKNCELTYAELDSWANAISLQIVEKLNPKLNDRIAILCRPGAEMIASMLAILKTGCTYVSLSPDVPEERNAYILSDSNTGLLLIEAALMTVAERMPDYIREVDTLAIKREEYTGLPAVNPAGKVTTEDSVYVIYTSGTTGTPKGVEVKHGGILNMLHFFNKCFHVAVGTHMSQVANVTFDASAFEIWPCLSHGGTLYIAPDEIRPDPDLMQSWLIDNAIEITYQPTALAEYLLRKKWNKTDHKMRVMNIAGDRLNFTPDAELPFKAYNLYGPTEDSIWTTWSEISSEKNDIHYSIGKPVGNKSVFILGRENNLQPVGVAGELCISGDGLAKGYINNEALSTDKFVKNPFFPGKMMYKTGDLAKWLPDGTIAFLGRVDNQVKIRGYRIELGEIESQLLKHGQVKEAAVVAKGIGAGKQLVGYYVAEHDIDPQELKAYLMKTLPDYMVPAHYVFVESMPFSSSGKLDRKRLPDPEFNISVDHIGASNDVEEKLVGIWSSILNIEKDKISIHSNFFELGGHSINIINLSHEIKQQFQCHISVASMFRLPTIAMMAEYIVDGDRGAEDMAGDIEESLIEAEDNINNLLNQLDD